MHIIRTDCQYAVGEVVKTALFDEHGIAHAGVTFVVLAERTRDDYLGQYPARAPLQEHARRAAYQPGARFYLISLD